MNKSSNQLNSIIIVAHNIRSSHNIGSIFRTAEGLGVNKLIISGYSPYPILKNDPRMPHIAKKVDNKIAKTALKTVEYLKWSSSRLDIKELIKRYKTKGYLIVGLEQSASSIKITKFIPTKKTLLIIGNEVEGIEQEVIDLCDQIIEIPMLGSKESFNVVQAMAMAVFYMRHLY